MRIGLIGTGAIAHKHALAYRELGFPITVCSNRTEESGRRFAALYDASFVSSFEDVCRHPDVDVVDVCTFPNFRLEPVRLCAETGKAVQLEKPLATTVQAGREIVRLAREAGLPLQVISQQRFEDSSRFLSRAIANGRFGRILQCDCYVKWYRSEQYYARPGKGTWAVEGGGALINQAIHQVDLVRWLAGPVTEVSAMWQLGSLHAIESEDVVNALLRFASGATGVVQASTAFQPGYSERIEIHGTKGSAVMAGRKILSWDVEDVEGEPPPADRTAASGASDPMAISTVPLERQFLDFADAIARGQQPLVTGEEALATLEVVEAIYESCRSRRIVTIG